MSLSCCMFCCALLYVHSTFAIILMGKRELVALHDLSSWCHMIILCLVLAVPWVCLRFVIGVYPYHTHLLFLTSPPELQLNKFNTSDTEAAFLDLHLSISNDIVSTNIYDTHDGT